MTTKAISKKRKLLESWIDATREANPRHLSAIVTLIDPDYDGEAVTDLDSFPMAMLKNKILAELPDLQSTPEDERKGFLLAHVRSRSSAILDNTERKGRQEDEEMQGKHALWSFSLLLLLYVCILINYVFQHFNTV